MRALLAAAALVLLAPPAAAHAVPADLLLDAAPGPVPPAGEGALLVPASFQWRCAGLARENATGPQAVRFSATEAPAWARVALEPAEADLPACEGIGTLPLVVRVEARNGTIPVAPGRLTLRATWLTDGAELATTAEATLTAAYVLRANVTAERVDASGGPQEVVTFPVLLTNRGNAIARFAFEVVDKTPPLQVPVPAPVTLAPGANATVHVAAQTPFKNGRVDQADAFTLRVVPRAALEPSLAGDPVLLSFSVRTEGWYAPGPGAALALAAAACALLILRRRA